MSALGAYLVRMRPRSRMRISLCASRGSMLTISDLLLPGIGGSFGTARIGSSRRRCALGTLLARSAVTPRPSATTSPRKPAASQAQRLSMPLSAWLVPIDGSRPLSTNGILIRGS